MLLRPMRWTIYHVGNTSRVRCRAYQWSRGKCNARGRNALAAVGVSGEAPGPVEQAAD